MTKAKSGAAWRHDDGGGAARVWIRWKCGSWRFPYGALVCIKPQARAPVRLRLKIEILGEPSFLQERFISKSLRVFKARRSVRQCKRCDAKYIHGVKFFKRDEFPAHLRRGLWTECARASYASRRIEEMWAAKGIMERNDKQLLADCGRGDEAAWETLVHRYQRLIYAIPRRAGLDTDAAAEVFQEVFLTLSQKLHGIEQPERLQAWLVTTARRKTWRHITRERSAQQFVMDEDGEDESADVPDNKPLPDEELFRLEEQHRVRASLDSLDERCRKLLTMLFYTDEPPAYAEIAAALGTTEGSIGPTRARCLKKMLALLEKPLSA